MPALPISPRSRFLKLFVRSKGDGRARNGSNGLYTCVNEKVEVARRSGVRDSHQRRERFANDYRALGPVAKHCYLNRYRQERSALFGRMEGGSVAGESRIGNGNEHRTHFGMGTARYLVAAWAWEKHFKNQNRG